MRVCFFVIICRSISPADIPSIDGVLLHASKPLPGAASVLKHIQSLQIPFILLTNGGGRLDRVRADDLARRLDVDITVDNLVQSHTPFQDLVSGSWDVGIEGRMADCTVFVTGSHGDRCREVMHS